MKIRIIRTALTLPAALGILAAAAFHDRALAAEPGAAPTNAAAVAPARPSVLPFVEDDYDRALREARASQRPLFVEAWAPW